MPKQMKPPKYWIAKIVGAYVATESCQSKIEAVIRDIQADACKPKRVTRRHNERGQRGRVANAKVNKMLLLELSLAGA